MENGKPEDLISPILTADVMTLELISTVAHLICLFGPSPAVMVTLTTFSSCLKYDQTELLLLVAERK